MFFGRRRSRAKEDVVGCEPDLFISVFQTSSLRELLSTINHQPIPLVARILMGGLCGACLCAASNQSLIIGAILGGVGGAIGAFAGYEIRRKLVAGLNIKDIFIALLEDLVTVGLAYFFARSP